MLHRESLDFVLYFARAYPLRSALMVFLLILAGMGEGVGLLTLLPALEILAAEGGTGGQSSLTRAVSSVLGSVGLEPTLIVLLLLIIAAVSLKSIFLWLAMIQAGRTVAHVATQLRLEVISALLRARWSYFTSQPAGHLANTIGIEARRVSAAYWQACRAGADIIQVVIYVGIGVLISWRVTLMALIAGAVIILLLGGFISVSRRAGRRQTELMKSLAARLTDALHGIKPIKAMGREEHLGPLLVHETQGINDAQVRHVLASENRRLFQEPLLASMLALGLFGAMTLSQESFSTLMVMAVVFYRLVGRTNMIQTEYQEMAVGESALWSIRGIVEQAEAQRERNLGKRIPSRVEHAVHVDSVSFGYGEHAVLKDVSLTVPAGTFVAIIGPSGAGKTTIADLVLGLHRPQSGELFVDGIPMRELDLIAWRRMIGYVPQEMFLFHDTVFRNVALGDSDISREKVQEALEAAGAWGFVAQLEGGMDTIIGERGSKLSGGQRQRVALARALVTRPALLVLDEVTTALDPETEKAICTTLKKLCEETTILSISHQMAMMEIADSIYRLDNGRITEVDLRRATLPSAFE